MNDGNKATLLASWHHIIDNIKVEALESCCLLNSVENWLCLANLGTSVVTILKISPRNINYNAQKQNKNPTADKKIEGVMVPSLSNASPASTALGENGGETHGCALSGG